MKKVFIICALMFDFNIYKFGFNNENNITTFGSVTPETFIHTSLPVKVELKVVNNKYIFSHFEFKQNSSFRVSKIFQFFIRKLKPTTKIAYKIIFPQKKSEKFQENKKFGCCIFKN